VALDARGEGVRGGRMLVRVTRGAHPVRGLAEGGVRAVDGRVATRAIRGDRLLILMRPMAVQARGRGMHGNGRDLALHLPMAARAISRPVRLEGAAVEHIGRAVVAREGVAIHAIGVHARAKTLLRESRGMLDGRASGVAGRTPNRRHRPHGRRGELVALATRDVLLDDVHAVPGHAAIRAPTQFDVNPSARCATRAFVRTRAGTADQSGEHQQAEQYENGEPTKAKQDSLHPTHLEANKRLWRLGAIRFYQPRQWNDNIESDIMRCALGIHPVPRA